MQSPREEIEEIYSFELRRIKRNAGKQMQQLKEQMRRIRDLEQMIEDIKRREKEKRKRRATQPPRVLTDRNNRKIEVGNKVSILTEGKFGSAEGVVVAIKTKRIKVEDEDGKVVPRAPYNVKVVNAKEEEEESEGSIDFNTYWGITSDG